MRHVKHMHRIMLSDLACLTVPYFSAKRRGSDGKGSDLCVDMNSNVK